ncbi:type II secretion system protein [Thiomicrospira sp. XS5]|uniref:type II secretion system F family protein n=1 Tax=Thiomicrospira sp. XS5 TaxID=1775636 RepID=UPI0007486930|nr:type II secretion system F family protein [Thiomicrospira sp. XS5]KUJ74792.1 type II secretion system protein [Thiomicrospira sp. XS5]
MELYRYTGVNRFGKRVRGEVQASNEQDLEQRLRSAQIDLLSFKVKSPGLLGGFGHHKISRREIITLTTQFKQLLKAGVPLMEIIDELRKSDDSDATREMLSAVYESMEGGQSFSQALKPYENRLGSVYIALVAVGEKSGQMATVLDRLEAMLKWEESLAAKAKKVMVYPSIVGLVVLAVILMMMLFVVPELVSFIREMGGELSFATESLIAVSGFMQQYLLELVLVPIALWLGVKWWRKRSSDFRIQMDRLLFKTPLVGSVLYKLKVARFASTLAVMHSAGIHFGESLKLSATVVGNAYLQRNIERAMALIEEGETIHQAFALAEVFPSMAVRMVKVGEQTSNMDEALRNVSDYYDTEAKETIDRVEPAIEPFLTVVMALVVGWVMLAVLGPVYETISKVQ